MIKKCVMKKRLLWKVVGIAALIVIVAIAGGLIYVVYFLPGIPVPDLKVDKTAGRIERGKYLAYHVALCMDCHSVRDWNKFAGPIKPGTDGKGGETFDQSLGFPGVFYSANITPFNLSGFSDGELYRVITSGVAKDGRPLFPVMPYPNYRYLSTEDVYSIIAFIRTLEPIAFQPPVSKADFPMNIIMHTFPAKADPKPVPAKSDTIAYGKYLVTAGGCFDCHTRFDHGKYDMKMAFGGGREFTVPWGIIRSSNITFDSETGIGKYSKEAFVNRFKAYDIETFTPPVLGRKDFNTIMPWTMYGGMEKSDLESVYAYLKTLPFVHNQVVKFTAEK
jgi:hypothetical protein